MNNSLAITVLVENTAEGPELSAEHGLSYWIEAGGRRILFDTGQGKALFPNARQLGVDLSAVDTVAVSHGHYDHTGGLRGLFEISRPRLFVGHPEIFRPKLARRKDGRMADVGIGRLGEVDLRSLCREVMLTRDPTEVAPGVLFSGEIPHTTTFEDTGGPFFADRAGQTPDPLHDDAALILDAADGLVVLLGCAHSGVVNTLLHVRRMFPGESIQAVIGGMHLLNASDERLQATVEAFRTHEVARIAAGHCTGRRACERLAKSFGDRFMSLRAGAQFLFAWRREDNRSNDPKHCVGRTTTALKRPAGFAPGRGQMG